MGFNNVEKRTLSYLIDYSIALIISVLLILFANLTFIESPFLNNITKVLSLTFFVYLIISIVFLKLFKGRTIGRFITGLRVCSISGSKLGFGQIIIRSLSESLLIMGVINLGYTLYYKNNYTLFDKISDTCVK